MKKSLIALAVAGAFAAPAFAATSNVDIYGVMNMALQGQSGSASAATDEDLAVVDNVSRIGFKGSEDLGGGLKAVWQIESAVSAGSSLGGSGVGSATAFAGRNTFVGLAGGFGTVLMGRHDTPYKLGTGSLDPFADTIADYNGGVTGAAGSSGSRNTASRLGVDLLNATHDYRASTAVAYISPTVSGFHAAIAAIAANGADDTFQSTGDNFDAISATAVYSNGPLFASLSYQDVEVVDSQALKIGVGYTFGDAKVAAIYETIETGAATERDSWLINGVYNIGPVALKAEYGQLEANNVDSNLWAVGVDYNMSKRTTAYFVYGSGDTDAVGTVSGWNLGMKHSF